MALGNVNYSGFSGGYTVPASELTSGNITTTYAPFVGFATTPFTNYPGHAFVFDQIVSTSSIYNYTTVGSNQAVMVQKNGVYVVQGCINLANISAYNSGQLYIAFASYTSSGFTTLSPFCRYGPGAAITSGSVESLFFDTVVYLNSGTAISFHLVAGSPASGAGSASFTRFGYFMVHLISLGT